MWVWPQLVFGGSPPNPHCNWRTLPSSQSPSLPALSLPSSPHPPWLFLQGSGRGGPGWWGGGVLGRKGVEGGGASKRHLGPDPHLGALERRRCGHELRRSSCHTLLCLLVMDSNAIRIEPVVRLQAQSLHKHEVLLVLSISHYLQLRTPRPATEPRNGPTRNFHEKYRKKYPLARNSGLPEFTPKIPKKHPQNTKNAHFWYFFGILGYFLGVPDFRPGGFFSAFFVEIPGRAISGLCSRSGRS